MRRNLSFSDQQQASQQVCKQIITLSQFQQANTIAFYQATQGEIDMTCVWKNALAHHKKCYFPYLHQDNSLSFLPATQHTLFRPNRYGISEPDVNSADAIPLELLDVILIPLVAFDSACHRIGMGLGCYDRTLTQPHHSWLLGIAYEFQLQETIETEDWDITLDGVITEKKIYWRDK